MYAINMRHSHLSGCGKTILWTDPTVAARTTTELKVSCTQTPPERMGASANRTRTQFPSRRSSSDVSVRRRTSPVVVHSMNLLRTKFGLF